MADESMTRPDPTEIFMSAITFDGVGGTYGGRIEVTSYRLPEGDPMVTLTATGDGVIASVERSM